MEGDYLTKVQSDFHPGFPLNHRNKVIHTTLKQFEKYEPDSGLSMKFCLDGKEHYRMNGSQHEVTSGKFLLVNRRRDLHCWIDSEKAVEGICYYVDEEIVKDVIQTMNRNIDSSLVSPFHRMDSAGGEFREIVLTARRSLLGNFLADSAIVIRRDSSIPGGSDFFYRLAEILVAENHRISAQVNGIEAEKKSTREELFRRVTKAREWIEDCQLSQVTISELARECCLSEYHLHRTFRQVFGISPHQYLISCRIETAKILLQKENLRVLDVAHQTGFSDIHTFSKTFRKKTGVAPGKWRNSFADLAGKDKPNREAQA